MKLGELKQLDEIFDTRKESRREHGDHNWHNAIASKADHSAVKGFWLMQGDKKLSGPFSSHEKAASYKANRKDKIPASATIKEF